jgi:ubiquinone/menaquinone biosynthesis C-methylase UbiE
MMAKNTLLDAELILSYLPNRTDAKVADLGCGNFGYFVFPLAKLVGKHGRVYAVDIIKSALAEIKKKAHTNNLPQIETIWSNLEKSGGTKIIKNSLDAAFLINTLYQADKTLDMLKEAVRLLKPKGRLIIVDWNEEPSPLGPALTQRVKKDKLVSAILKLDLKLEKEFKPGAYHYGLVFKKL